MVRRAFFLLFVIHATLGLGCKDPPPRRLTIAVEGMTCSSCVQAITAALQKLPGVLKAKVELKVGRATVDYTPSRVTTDVLLKTITKLGYKARALPRAAAAAKSERAAPH